MKREFHVRFCESLKGWFLGATRTDDKMATLTLMGHFTFVGIKAAITGTVAFAVNT